MTHGAAQSSAEVVPRLNNVKAMARWDAFESVFKRLPRPEAECTIEQLAAVSALLVGVAVPYVDFCVWGPHHLRLLRLVRPQGLVAHGRELCKEGKLAHSLDFEAL